MNPRRDHEYWMNIVNGIAKASTCRKDLGCVIIQRDQIVGVGYVGSLSGDIHCNDDEYHNEPGCLFVETTLVGSSDKHVTCIRTIHAELNAVLHCMVRGSEQNGWLTAYCTYQPCLNCLKALLTIGTRMILWQHPYRDEWRDKLVKELGETWDKNLIYGMYNGKSYTVYERERIVMEKST